MGRTLIDHSVFAAEDTYALAYVWSRIDPPGFTNSAECVSWHVHACIYYIHTTRTLLLFACVCMHLYRDVAHTDVNVRGLQKELEQNQKNMVQTMAILHMQFRTAPTDPKTQQLRMTLRLLQQPRSNVPRLPLLVQVLAAEP